MLIHRLEPSDAQTKRGEHHYIVSVSLSAMVNHLALYLKHPCVQTHFEGLYPSLGSKLGKAILERDSQLLNLIPRSMNTDVLGQYKAQILTHNICIWQPGTANQLSFPRVAFPTFKVRSHNLLDAGWSLFFLRMTG